MAILRVLPAAAQHHRTLSLSFWHEGPARLQSCTPGVLMQTCPRVVMQALRTCQMTPLRGAALAGPHQKMRNPFQMRTTSSMMTWEGARPGSGDGISALAAVRASPTRPCRCVVRRGRHGWLWLLCGEECFTCFLRCRPGNGQQHSGHACPSRPCSRVADGRREFSCVRDFAASSIWAHQRCGLQC